MGTASPLAIKTNSLLRNGELVSACVLIKDGKIVDIVKDDAIPAGYAVHDVGDNVVMSGLVDSHVHINEPGRTEWEGFDTATRAAAAGGITTLTDMPLNCIPVTTSSAAFDEKLRHIAGRIWIDVCFWGGVVPGNAGELDKMMRQGVMGFKCFLIHSGIDDFPNVERPDLEQSMPILAEQGLPLLVHAELDLSHGVNHKPLSDEPHKYANFLASRPRSWENEAIKLMIELCREFDCRVHIVHLSSSDALPLIAKAKADGLKITTETCPHYLTLAAEDVPDGNTAFKCTPPIRERENSDKLWQGLEDGTIDFIVSDHSPCTPELKLLAEGNFDKAWGGISSLQLGLPAIWTEAKRRGYSLSDVSRWMSYGPAKFLGIDNVKGSLEPGHDGDIVVFAPDQTFTLDQSMIHHRHKLTPHMGSSWQGKVLETYVRGNKVYDHGQFADQPLGKAILDTNKGAYTNANVHT